MIIRPQALAEQHLEGTRRLFTAQLSQASVPCLAGGVLAAAALLAILYALKVPRLPPSGDGPHLDS
jgi:hypothetical protein